MSELQAVVFSLNGQLFGADASQVLQLVKYHDVAKPSRMPDFIEGIMDYQGAGLPLISLVRRFGLGETEITKKTKILVTKRNESYAGFIVNDVTQILKFNDEDIESAPSSMGGSVESYIKKVCKKEDRLIPIIDMEKVLNDDEMKKLSSSSVASL